MKIYRAYTDLSLSIVLPSGKSKYIIFNSESNGKSVYSTSSEDIITALEKNSNFGKSFYLEKSISDEKLKRQEEMQKAVGGNINEKKYPYTEVPCNSWEDAKEYLVKNYDVSPTKIKLPSQIQKAAQSFNVNFIMED